MSIELYIACNTIDSINDDSRFSTCTVRIVVKYPMDKVSLGNYKDQSSIRTHSNWIHVISVVNPLSLPRTVRSIPHRSRLFIVRIHICDPLERIRLCWDLAKYDVVFPAAPSKGPHPSCCIGFLPISFPSTIVVFVKVNVNAQESRSVWSPKEIASFVAVCLVNLENSSLLFAHENGVCIRIDSQKEELFAANILLFKACCCVRTRVGKIDPGIDNSTVHRIHDCNRGVSASSPHLMVSREKKLVVKIVHDHVLAFDSCCLVS